MVAVMASVVALGMSERNICVLQSYVGVRSDGGNVRSVSSGDFRSVGGGDIGNAGGGDVRRAGGGDVRNGGGDVRGGITPDW